MKTTSVILLAVILYVECRKLGGEGDHHDHEGDEHHHHEEHHHHQDNAIEALESSIASVYTDSFDQSHDHHHNHPPETYKTSDSFSFQDNRGFQPILQDFSSNDLSYQGLPEDEYEVVNANFSLPLTDQDEDEDANLLRFATFDVWYNNIHYCVSRYQPTLLDDGTTKKCIEKEAFREELKYAEC